MVKLKVLTISGHAQNGKDTLGKMLGDKLSDSGYRVLITHYGDLLKWVCKSFFGWNGKKDEAGRTLLQHIGTDVVRAKRPNFWVDFIADILYIFQDEWDYVIIPDTRFPNEIVNLEYMGLGVSSIWVERPGYDNGMTEEQLSHASENALKDTKFDFYFVNDGTVEDLNKKASKWIEENVLNEQ